MSASRSAWKLDPWDDGEATSPYFVVDVFTDTPLEGNQLGVFPDPGRFSSEQMQRLASEMNFSTSVRTFCNLPSVSPLRWSSNNV